MISHHKCPAIRPEHGLAMLGPLHSSLRTRADRSWVAFGSHLNGVSRASPVPSCDELAGHGLFRYDDRRGYRNMMRKSDA